MKQTINGTISLIPDEIFSGIEIEEKLKAWGQKTSQKKMYVRVKISSPLIKSWVDSPYLSRYYGVKIPRGSKKTLKRLFGEENQKMIGNMRRFLSYFPGYFPVETLENLKEGDTLTLKYKNYVFKLNVQQRYLKKPFEEVLKEILL